jgi:hypothetical protein
MKFLYAAPAALAVFLSPATAQDQDIQRALIQRDQQSAEFAARIRGVDTSGLEQLHAQQLRDAALPLNPDPAIARQLEPYQRQKMADERVLAFPPPVIQPVRSAEPPVLKSRPLPPLPFPGGERQGIDPVPPQGS